MEEDQASSLKGDEAAVNLEEEEEEGFKVEFKILGSG